MTPGKIYEIYKVEGYGDCADFYFKDDSGKEQYLADFFFEEVENGWNACIDAITGEP